MVESNLRDEKRDQFIKVLAGTPKSYGKLKRIKSIIKMKAPQKRSQ